VGKTTISKALAERLNAHYINLRSLVNDGNLVIGVDEKRETLVTDLDGLSVRIQKIVDDSSKDIVVEGHYASDVIPPRLATYVFVLRRDPDDLLNILKERGYRDGKVLENIASEVLDVCLINALEKSGPEIVDEIDTTHMRVEEVVDELQNVISGQRKPEVGNVDWLRRLEKDNRIERLLNQLSRL
jgi:adenylate kinase